MEVIRLFVVRCSDQRSVIKWKCGYFFRTTFVIVRMGGRPLCNLWFADDIDLLGGSEELQQLTERLEKTAAGYDMEISYDKSTILVNSTKPTPSKSAGRSGQHFKYLGWIHTNQRPFVPPIKELWIRLAQAHLG